MHFGRRLYGSGTGLPIVRRVSSLLLGSPFVFEITVTDDLDSLFDDAQRWDALTRGVPFRETAWLRPWWRHYGFDRQPHVLLARDYAGELRGLLPLYRTACERPGRTLAIMGDGEACSDYVSVLACEEDAEPVAETMGRFLADNAADDDLGWDLLDIDGVVEGDRAMAALARGLKAGAAVLHTQSRMHVWSMPSEDSWQQHLKHYGKTQRRRVRRMSEKVGGDGPVIKRVAGNETEVATFLASLIEMHQRRWNDAGEAGSFARPEFRAFAHDTAQAFAAAGRLYMSLLSHEGSDIAAEFNLIGENRVLYCFSAGYDTDFADMEPGRLAMVDTLQQLYRADLAGIDFMRGDEEYKKRFATESRRLLRMRAVPPSLLPRLKHAAWWTTFEVKQWARRRSGRTPIDVLKTIA